MAALERANPGTLSNEKHGSSTANLSERESVKSNEKSSLHAQNSSRNALSTHLNERRFVSATKSRLRIDRRSVEREDKVIEWRHVWNEEVEEGNQALTLTLTEGIA